MREFIHILLLLFTYNVCLAVDSEVERVEDPFVEKMDIGQYMEVGGHGTKRNVHQGAYSSNSAYDRCITCHKLFPSHSSGAMGSSPNLQHFGQQPAGSSYAYPNGFGVPQSSSTKHEYKSKQEFVNGQQVYGLHHEKQYEDGTLVKDKKIEKNADDYSPNRDPSSKYNSGYPNGYSTYSSGYSSTSSGNGHYPLSNSGNAQRYSSHTSQSNTNLGGSDFSGYSSPDINKLWDDIRKKQNSYGNNFGGTSHKTHSQSSSHSIQGQPVYSSNSELVYENGKLVKNVSTETGSKVDLTPKIGYGNTYGSEFQTRNNLHHQSISEDRNQNSYSQYPTGSYQGQGSIVNSRHKPSTSNTGSYQSSYSTFSSHNTDNSHPSKLPLNGSPFVSSNPSYYNPIYSSEITKQHKEQKVISNYQPKVYGGSYFSSRKDDYNPNYPSTYSSGPGRYRGEPRTITTESPYYPSRGYSFNEQEEKRLNRYDSHQQGRNGVNDDLYNPKSPYSNSQTRKEYETTYNRPITSYSQSQERNIYSSHDHRGYSPHPSATNPDSKQPQNPRQTFQAGQTDSHYERPRYFDSSTSQTHNKENRYNSIYNANINNLKYRPDDRNGNVENPHLNSGQQIEHLTGDVGIPGVVKGPIVSPNSGNSKEEAERYDISPFEDASDNDVEPEPGPIPKEEIVGFNSYPTAPTNNRDAFPSSYESSSISKTSQNSRTSSGYLDSNNIYPEHNRFLNPGQHGEYGLRNSTSFTDRRYTTLIPSKRTETKTTWKYVNGVMVSEIKYHKYYENDILIYQNITERSRDEMIADGMNVRTLDLNGHDLAKYGQIIPHDTRSHSQKHEFNHIERFQNGKKIYELNQEKLFQDGDLVHENQTEKNKNDFEDNNGAYDGRYFNEFESGHNSYNPPGSIHTAGLHQSTDFSLHPETYVRKHEFKQKQEFVDGKKVYDLHHEREYKDGQLVRENKTELGPEDLGYDNSRHRDALHSVLHNTGNTLDSSSGALYRQKVTSDNVLRTGCVTCNTHSGSFNSYGNSNMRHGTSGGILTNFGLSHNPNRIDDGETYRHDMNVEEHYSNGKLVRGHEEEKKWKDGQLIDQSEETYYSGPSRTDLKLPGHATGGNYGSARHETSSSSFGQSDQVSNHMINVDPSSCTHNPCQNSGRCHQKHSGVMCMCSFGFKGTYCEEAYCPTRFCRYGGSCSIENRKHKCDCPEGYSGHRCTTRVQKVRVAASG